LEEWREKGRFPKLSRNRKNTKAGKIKGSRTSEGSSAKKARLEGKRKDRRT